MVESTEMDIHRSSVVTLASKHLVKMVIDDFNRRGVFAAVLASTAFSYGRLNLVFASHQPEMRDMLENARLNLLELCDLEQVL